MKMNKRVKVLPVHALNKAIRAPNSRAGNLVNTKKNKQSIVLEIFNDYCSSSTLHGVSYLGAEDKSRVEKIWWLIMIVLSVGACSYLITRTWIKWNENPVILSFEKEQIPVWEIPFPAVTVCPVNKIVQFIYNYTHYYRNRNNLTDEEHKLFSDLSLVCNIEQYYLEFNSTINFTDEEAIASIRKMAPHEPAGRVTWQNDYNFELDYFTPQLTEEGICYSFNSFNQEDMFTDQINKDTEYINHNFTNENWNFEDGYPADLNDTVYPRRTAKDGRLSGLSFTLYSMNDETDYVCGLPISGYKIILHTPAETPKVADQYFLIPLNKKVSITVRPELTRTDNNLKSISPDIRKCFFSNERYLRFYKVYTQNNCRAECNANISKEYCGCVSFYMPRDENTRICGYGKHDCVSAILNFEMKGTLPSELEEGKLERLKNIFSKCNCLPSCSSLQYTAETSLTEIHLMKSYLTAGVYDDLSNMSQEYKNTLEKDVTASQVDIFFKESQFLALRRSELYGQTDFLANCGGLLGLFMGFSILSVLEIVYFLTIRLWFKYKVRQKKN